MRRVQDHRDHRQRHSLRGSSLAIGLAIGLVLTTCVPTATAAPRFLRHANSTTITTILPPRTQSKSCCPGCSADDACFGCASWAATMGTLFAYWDSYTYQGKGPWAKLLPGGHATDLTAYRRCTLDLFILSGKDDCELLSAGAWAVGFCSSSRDLIQQYAYSKGYWFAADADDWVWWGKDVKDEIDQEKPVYYGYYPEYSPSGDVGLPVVVVGYEDADEILWFYNTYDHAVHSRGFDEADEHCTVNVTPGGTDCSSGTCCSASGYFRPDTEVCAPNAESERGCPWGTGCGKNLGMHTRDRYCSGEGSDCDGAYGDWKPWQTAATCAATQVCDPAALACVDQAGCSCQCASGDCCDGCKFRPVETVCDQTVVATEYRCTGTGCGADPQKRVQRKHCSGTSASCGSDNLVWGDWENLADCGPNAICKANASGASCETCPGNCVDGICVTIDAGVRPDGPPRPDATPPPLDAAPYRDAAQRRDTTPRRDSGARRDAAARDTGSPGADGSCSCSVGRARAAPATGGQWLLLLLASGGLALRRVGRRRRR